MGHLTFQVAKCYYPEVLPTEAALLAFKWEGSLYVHLTLKKLLSNLNSDSLGHSSPCLHPIFLPDTK